MVVQDIHRLAKQVMAEWKSRVVVLAERRYQVVQRQSQGRVAGFSRRHLGWNIHVAPRCVRENLVKKEIELVRVAVATRLVGRQDRDNSVGQIGVGGVTGTDNAALQNRLQRERSGRDGKRVTH